MARDYDGVLVSPGPGTPEEAGIALSWSSIAPQIQSRSLVFAWATKPLVLHLVAPYRAHPNYFMARHQLLHILTKVCCAICHHHSPQRGITRWQLKMARCRMRLK